MSARGVLDSALYGIAPRDPAIILAVAGIMLGVATIAAWVPARRAARIAPIAALGSD